MICITTDRWNENEPDILSAHRHKPLRIKLGDSGIEITEPAPVEGWTTAALNDSANRLYAGFSEVADAFLGHQWVGSTEV